MKKRSLLILAVAAMLAFSCCSGEKDKTATTIGTSLETQKNGIEIAEGKESPAVTEFATQKEFAEHLRIAHDDQVSADMVEQGYYYAVNKSYTDGRFQIDFKGVTGDMVNPMLVFDVYVNDEELAAEYDEIVLYAYILGENEYARKGTSYGTCEGIGKADERQNNLYHVTMRGTPAWITEGIATVVDVCQVDFVKTSEQPVTYPINIPESRLTIPQTKFYPVLEMRYSGVSFTHGGREYVLKTAEYGMYDTRLNFECLVNKKQIYTEPNRTEHFDDGFQLIWKEFLSNVELEVDGKIYSVNDNTYMTFFENGGTEQYRGIGIGYTPGVKFAWANEAKIWVGTVGYDLKSGSKTPLTRELSDEPRTPAMNAEQKEFVELLRNKCKDETSARLAELGYCHIVNETREDEAFRIDFKGLTGDMENLKMVFDVYVENEVLTQMYPVLRLDVYCGRKKNYNPYAGNAWNCTGYGVQDAENKKLYHVVMNGYIFAYEPMVTDICRVGFDVDTDSTNGEFLCDVNTEPYYVDVPQSVSAPVLRGNYSGMKFICGERIYEVEDVVYGQYYVDVRFRTLIDAENVPTDDAELLKYREEIQKEWAEFFPSLTLVADGKEYKVVDEDGKRGYIGFDVEEGAVAYRGQAHPLFPAVDYYTVSELKIKAGDTVYELK